MTTRSWGRSLLDLLLAGVLAAVAGGLPVVARPAPPEPPRLPEAWRFTLPAGDAVAGEAVFIRMKCAECHNVAGRDAGSARPQAEGLGPELTGAQARLPAEYLAERMITTDRFLPHGLFRATYSRSDGSSRMSNYNEEMSVKELIDLVAYLRSIGTPSR